MTAAVWAAAVSVNLLAAGLMMACVPHLAGVRRRDRRRASTPPPGPPPPPLPRRLRFPPEPVHLSPQETADFWESAFWMAMIPSEFEREDRP